MALTKDQIDALKQTMYSRPLSEDEVRAIASTTDSMGIAYHSTSGGITFYEADESTVLFSLSGFGIKDTINSALMKHVLENIPTYASWILEMFAQGVLTLEQVDITSLVYKENFEKQVPLDHIPNASFAQFKKSNDGVYEAEAIQS